MRKTAEELPFSSGTKASFRKHYLKQSWKPQMSGVTTGSLGRSVSANNSLQNHHRMYSPNQFVFWHNMYFPSLITERVPALVTGVLRIKYN